MVQTPTIARLSGVVLIIVMIIAFVGIFTMRQPHQTAPAIHASTTPIATLHLVDWANFIYPHGCFSNSTGAVHVTSGQGTDANGWHMTIGTPVYAAITGTVPTEAIIPYDCVNADAMGTHVFIFSGTSVAPTLLARLPDDNEAFPKLMKVDTTTIASNATLRTVTLGGAGAIQSDPHCCPSLLLTNTYTWDGTGFQLTHQTQQAAAVTVTATTPATATPPLTAQQYANCFGSLGGAITQANVIQVGDIAFGDFIGPFAYPSRVLPAGVISPYQLTGDPATNFAPSFGGDADPFIDPTVHGANAYTASFIVQICNLATTTTHHVSELGASVSHFTPYTGSLNVWVPTPCDSTYYASASQKVVESGGCGGAFPTDIQATAAFPTNNTTGTAVTDALTGNTALAPGASVAVALKLALPALPGSYTLTPFLRIDGGVRSDGAPGAPYLYAPVAHVWDGKACASASIPSSPPANYICSN